MTDLSLSLLLPHLQSITNKTLWIADENALGIASAITRDEKFQAISNRYDIFVEMQSRGLNATFSDYDFSAQDDNSFDTIIYRVSKERAVVHHIFNHALRLLKNGGKLLLAGEKSEGIKGYVDKAGKLFGDKVSAKKQGNAYFAELIKHSDYSTRQSSGTLLDDKQYQSLRATGELTVNNEALSLYSKPGQFGWNKKDQGSELLISTAETYFAERDFPNSIIDLGCGYGFLTLKTKGWPTTIRSATDNNAAALASAKKNFLAASMVVELTADDCGSAIEAKFQCVLCNPPFHQGFSNDSELTQKFLSNTARLTVSTGVALFVVNQFIGLEKMALEYFSKTETLASDGQFKVIALYH
jgi:16S rRNA (guanine1207-N2)-methyltransferase